jgi:hypothetical protein
MDERQIPHLKSRLGLLCCLVWGLSPCAAFAQDPLPKLSPASTQSLKVKDAPKWLDWKVVGRAQLKWIFFDLYQSKLLTPSGHYREKDGISVGPLALYIRYQRAIDKQNLLKATEEQWQKMGLKMPASNAWQAQLEKIFPSVRDGDRLVYQSDGHLGQFFFSAQDGPFYLIGQIQDPKLNQAFLAIWLSPKSNYPSLRLQLLGQKK